MLALVAHELRNPIAPLRHGLDLLRLQVGRVPAVANVLKLMDRQLDQLAVVVSDLLDVGRLGTDGFHLDRQKVSLSAVISCSVDAVRTAISARKLNLAVEDRAPGCVVSGDFSRLVQVFTNLLGNAAKFTPAGGSIRITVEAQQHEAVLSVSDTGVGIAPEDQARIFELFESAPGSTPGLGGGLGIGLAIARALVSLHGGRLSVASEGRRQGSTFTVRLPLADGEAASSSPPTARVPVSPRRVMVIDDNVDVATSLAYLLEAMGHEVAVAHDGEAALPLADRTRPDVVLLDLGLPGMNGLEVCERLRALPHGAQMRVVALTGWGARTDSKAALASGFDAVALKPVSARKLTDLICPPIETAPLL